MQTISCLLPLLVKSHFFGSFFLFIFNDFVFAFTFCFALDAKLSDAIFLG